jgi:hypothetical protein
MKPAEISESSFALLYIITGFEIQELLRILGVF